MATDIMSDDEMRAAIRDIGRDPDQEADYVTGRVLFGNVEWVRKTTDVWVTWWFAKTE